MKSMNSDSSGGRKQDSRYQPTTAYRLAERVKSTGVALHEAEGPWRTVWRRWTRVKREEFSHVPVVTNGDAEVMVDTLEHAVDLSGFLNWCGVHQLNPIPALAPPSS